MADNNIARGPARAIEAALVNVASAAQGYRRYRAVGETAVDTDTPVLDFQAAVEDAYDLMRPYIRDAPSLREYWEGAVAPHPAEPFAEADEARKHYRSEASGVWQLQEHIETVGVTDRATEQPAVEPQSAASDPTILADGGRLPETLRPKEWHDALKLPTSTRVGPVFPTGDADDLTGYMVVTFRCAVIGLRDIETWEVGEVNVRSDSNGFMAADSGSYFTDDDTTQTEPDPEEPRKIEAAAKLLFEAAAELGAFPELSVSDKRPAEFDPEDFNPEASPS